MACNRCYKHTNKDMKANELRIGNLVYYRKDVLRVSKIVKYRFECEGLNGFIDYTNLDCDTFEPIKLNNKWLLKFGFEKDKDNVFQLSNCVFWLDTGFIQIANCYTPIMNINCKYVHQLQNLYFALKGEELTVK